MSCEHEWVVFNTAIQQGALMLSCATCQAFGVVEDPTEEQWDAAFHATSQPYRWEDGERVRVVREGPTTMRYVQKTPGGYAPSPGWKFFQELAREGSANSPESPTDSPN